MNLIDRIRKTLKIKKPKGGKASERPTSAKTSLRTKRQSVYFGTSLSPILTSLGAVFFMIWILIGIFVLLVLVQGIRSGAYSGLLGSRSSPPTATTIEPSAPTETELQGIGRVNIACVKQALSQDSLMKLLKANNDLSVLTPEEKQKFEPCIVQKETPGPSASPAVPASPAPSQ